MVSGKHRLASDGRKGGAPVRAASPEAVPVQTLPAHLKGLRIVRLCLGGVSSALLLCLMLLTFVDVLGRYLFRSPVPGATEITEILLMGVIFTGLPAVCLDDSHINVDLILSRLRGRLLDWQRVAARLIGVLVLSVVAWRIFVYAESAAQYNEVTPYLLLPLAPFAFVVAVLVALAVLLLLVMLAFSVEEGALRQSGTEGTTVPPE